MYRLTTFVELMERRNESQSDKVLYRYVRDDETTVQLTRHELYLKAKALATKLRMIAAASDRVLILCPQGIDYIVAIYGCLYAGMIAVPGYPPRNHRNCDPLATIIRDADPRVVLTTSKTFASISHLAVLKTYLEPTNRHWVFMDDLNLDAANGWTHPQILCGDIAFLQYTAGSTGHPKGVIITHENLMVNESMIQHAFRVSEDSVVVSWLPLFHDMGLIGMLQAAYAGAVSVHISPAMFLQRPWKWLKTITDYRATISGGPNFAYDLCVRKVVTAQLEGLDLRTWCVAYNGAERVRPETLERFAKHFAGAGFQPKAFYPCYGLAEATLFVTGGKVNESPLIAGRSTFALQEQQAEQDRSNDQNRIVSCGTAGPDGNLLIVDPQTLRKTAPENIGEIWVSGPHVAKGYWRAHKLTLEMFGAHLSDTGEGPFLRTGDLGFISNGELYVTGRLKDLIIIRGVNYHPQDLEQTAEQSHPALAPAAGAAFSVEMDLEEKLVLVLEVRRDFRRQNLSEAMEAICEAISETHGLRVHAIQLLKPGTIPKTSSGKIRRSETRLGFLKDSLEKIAAYNETDSSRKMTTPNSQEQLVEHLFAKQPAERKLLVEAFLLSSISEILGVPIFTLSAGKSLTAMGVDSMLASELKNRLEAQLGVSIPFTTLLSNSSISELASETLTLLTNGSNPGAHAIASLSRTAPEQDQLTPDQQALWLFFQLAPGSAAYNEACAFRVKPRLNAQILRQAVVQLVTRHEVLRSIFVNDDGAIRRQVLSPEKVTFEEIDASSWRPEQLTRVLNNAANQPFNLETTTPLRVQLYQQGSGESVLLIVAHHIGVDMWSFLILIKELVHLYETVSADVPVSLPRLQYDYADYARWKHELLASERGEILRDYWRKQLHGAWKMLDLPADRPREPTPSYEAGVISWNLSETLTRNLKALASNFGSSLYQALLASFQVLLHRHSGQHEIIVCSPFAGRTKPEFENLVGYFVNPLPLRGDFTSNPTFAEFLHQVGDIVRGALEHQDYPCASILEQKQTEQASSGPPRFRVMFTFQNQHGFAAEGGGPFFLNREGGRLSLGHMELESIELERQSTQFDLSLTLVEHEGGLLGTIEFNAAIFERETVERMGARLCQILSQVVENPNERVRDLEILAPDDIKEICDSYHGPRRNYPQDKLIHELIEDQAQKTPDAVVALDRSSSLNYGELDVRSNKLAAYLQKIGIGTEDIVGILLDRTPDLLWVILGILKSGAAFQPLATDHPQERLAHAIKGSRLHTIISARQFRDKLPPKIAKNVIWLSDLDAIDPDLSRQPEKTRISLDDLAYVITTSGSTGVPNAVTVTHRSILNVCYAWPEVHNWEDENGYRTSVGNYLQSARVTFDAFLADFFRALCHGGKLVFCSEEQALAPAELYRLMREERVDVVDLVPAVIRNLFEYLEMTRQNLGFLKLIVIGSDVWFIHEYKKLRRLCGTHTRILNNFGVTEATVDNTFFDGDVQGLADKQIVPIGRPLPNINVYIVDRDLKCVPPGIPGELCIGGAAPARGYLNNPELTDQKFVTWVRPDGQSDRIYRTGDLARFRFDGQIELLGRIDNQIKLNGQRIDPAEIESLLVAESSVKAAVVLAREDVPGRQYLTAYVATYNGKSCPGEELREKLKSRLPRHMLPAVFVTLDELPLTKNGKVDRQAVAAIIPDRRNGRQYVAPKNPKEEKLKSIWEQILGVENVSVDENFFELGGHSLLAMQALARIREAFQVDVPMSELFVSPTPAEFARALSRYSIGQLPENLRLRPALPRNNPPLSFAQKRLWFLNQLEPENPFYNMSAAVRLKGTLNKQAVELAFTAITQRHEPLRYQFDEVDGSPVLSVLPHWDSSLSILDLSGLSPSQRERELMRLTQAEVARPFDLSMDALFRATLFRLDEQEHVVLVTMHHIISDGWSSRIMLREFAALYEDFSTGTTSRLDDLPLSYSDFSEWQQQTLQSEAFESQVAYWLQKLGGHLPVLSLPTDRPRPRVQTYRGKTRHHMLPKELSVRLRELSRVEGVTLFMTLLAAFKVLLSWYSSQNDIIAGTPIAGRPRAELEKLIGFFANTLTLRTDLSGNPTFKEVLKRVCDTCLDAFAHQDVPFEILVDRILPERSISHSPIFQVVFAFEHELLTAPALNGLTTSLVEVENSTAKFDLTVFVAETEGGLKTSFEYNTDLFDDETVQGLAEHYELILQTFAHDPERQIGSFSLLTREEYQRVIVEWNETSAELPDRCAHELFEEQVRKTPHAIAAVYGSDGITYHDLNRRANQLAHFLIRNGIGPDSLAPLLVDRSIDYLAAILATLKAGGAFIPLNPQHPVARQRKILETSRSKVLVLSRKYVETISTILSGSEVDRAGGLTLCVLEDILEPSLSQEAEENPTARARLDHLACVFFTSGSTGVPKGAMVEHRGMLNHLMAKIRDLNFGSGDVVAQNASQAFDISVWQFLSPLVVGAKTMIIVDEEVNDAERLLKRVDDGEISILETVPTMLRAILEVLETTPEFKRPQLSALRWLISNAEPLPAELCRRWFALYSHIPMVNTWGATECSDDVTHLHIVNEPNEMSAYMPLGRRLINIRLYIVNEHLCHVPLGVAGELCIAGISVGRGYLGDSEKTVSSFFEDPYNWQERSRLYKTGDIARYRRDGSIEFLGRKDDQVKIRGHRVETGEIEAALLEIEGIRNSVVTASPDRRGLMRLTAYLEPVEGGFPDVDTIKDHLSQQLPPYMIPSAFVVIASLPLNSNGKVDRKRLPAPREEDFRTSQTYTAPRTRNEEIVIAIFQEVLDVEGIGVHENFFELGGHSLLATRVISRLRKVFRTELPIRVLFETRTVAELARQIEEKYKPELNFQGSALVPQPRGNKPLPLSFAQQRLWFLDQLEPGSPLYNQATAFQLIGSLDTPALQESLREVGRRHETLRTTFGITNGEPHQVVHEKADLDLPITDLSSLPEKRRQEEVLRRLHENGVRPFELARGPLFRAELLRLGEEEHVLLLNLHHIISDGWSEAVLIQEITALYTAFTTGGKPSLPPLPIQYADFAIWQREQLRDGAFQTQLDYWREQLGNDLPALELPTDRARPSVETFRGAKQNLTLSPALSQSLKDLSSNEGVTPFMTLLGAFQTLLFRYSGQTSIAVGSPIANRRLTELEGLIGFFANTLVIRTDFSSELRFREVLERIRKITLEAYAHQDLPFERLVEELQPKRDLSRSPLFQVMFALENFPVRTLKLPGLNLNLLDMHNGTSKFDLVFFMWEMDGSFCGMLEYNSDLFDAATISRMLAHFEVLLEAIVTDPEQSISMLPLLTRDERTQILYEWNKTAKEFSRTGCVHQSFEAQVQRTPNEVAVVFEDQQSTYGELNRRANQLAHYLRKLGVSPESLVGICLEPSPEILVSLLAVIKAGGSAVALDFTYPMERLAHMVVSSKIAILLTQQSLLSRLPEHDLRMCLDSDWERVSQESEENPVNMTEPDNLLYTIYTSGSTGIPKAIGFTHRAFMNLIEWQQSDEILSRPAKTVQFAIFGFCVSFQEILSTLMSGETVILIPDVLRRDPERLLDLVEAAGVERLYLPFAALKNLAEFSQAHDRLPICLREVITAGEQLQVTSAINSLFNRLKNCSLHNQYGASETHVVSTFTLCPPVSAWPTLPPIGRPIANTEIYLLDTHLQPVPVGVAGEIFIGGDCLARGYLNDPALTAEKFIPHPFSDKEGARLYRTGDLARYLVSGDIQHYGRVDQQVKVRGYRIELGEIETTLREHYAINDAAVLAIDGPQGTKRLVAYVVFQSGQESDIGKLRNFVREKLPEFMVPTTFILVDALAVNANGKLDRQALPLPDHADFGSAVMYVPPGNDVEEVVASVWANLLNLERVGIHDDFFDLGGHSLLAVQLTSRLRDLFMVEIPVRRLFEAPTVAEFAQDMIRNERVPGYVEKAAHLIKKIQSMTAEERREMLHTRQQQRQHPN